MEKRIKVDFLAPPFEGHLNPLIEMAEKLKDKYDIRFITGKNKNEILINSGFQVENILTEENEVFERLFTIKKPFAMLVGVVGLFESQKSLCSIQEFLFFFGNTIHY